MRPRTLNAWRAVQVLCMISPMLLSFSAFAGREKEQASTAPANLFWPLPPDKPRVKFLETWNNNLQIEPIKKRGFFDKLAGVPDKNVLEEFEKPAGIAIDSRGRLLIASLGHATIYRVDREHKSLERLRGDRGFSLRSPLGLAVDEKDNIYVSDPQLHLVMKFDPDFHLIATFGSTEGIKNPSYIALDEVRRRLFVVDTKAHDVIVYNLDTLQLITKVGKAGNKNGEFLYPVGVGVNRGDGSFAVTDTGSCSVQVFDASFKFMLRFGKQAMTPGNFVRPKGVQFDSEGNIWVADAAFNNFQVFNSKGQVLMFVGAPGRGPGQFQLPNGLFIDKKDRVYVSDQLNYRVQIFQFLGSN